MPSVAEIHGFWTGKKCRSTSSRGATFGRRVPLIQSLRSTSIWSRNVAYACWRHTGKKWAGNLIFLSLGVSAKGGHFLLSLSPAIYAVGAISHHRKRARPWSAYQINRLIKGNMPISSKIWANIFSLIKPHIVLFLYHTDIAPILNSIHNQN